MLELTPIGSARLATLETRGLQAITEALQDAVQHLIKPGAAANAPTPGEEASIISESKEGVGVPTPMEPDAHGRVRFMKASGQKFVRQAILDDPVEIEAIGQATYAKTGNTLRLNREVQFSWKLASPRDEIRSSDWRHLIEMWEDGGQAGGPIIVRPRAPIRKLYPEPPQGGRQIFYDQLTKVVPPFQMYEKARARMVPRTGKGPVRAKLERSLSELAKRIGGRDWKVTVEI